MRLRYGRTGVVVIAAVFAIACARTPPRDAAPDAAASAPGVVPATPPPAACATAPDPGGVLGAWAREDAMPIAELFEKSTFLTGAIYRRVAKKHDRSGLASLTDVERDVFLAYTIDAEERLGGFAQYFSSEAGDRALSSLAALKAIGAAPFVALVQSAIALFPGSKPAADLSLRSKQIRAIADRAKWAALDKEWKTLADLSKTYIEPYLLAHRKDLEASNPH
jgi:hypothetical protein